MAYDANGVLQASTTKAASFNSAGLSLRQPSGTSGTNRGGTPRRGLKARVRVTAISGAPTVSFAISHSDDNATFTVIAQQLDAVFSAATGECFIPFDTDKPWVRLEMTLAGGAGPSVTYAGEIGLSRP